MRFNIGQTVIEQLKQIHTKIYLNNEWIGEKHFTERGIPVVSFPLKHSLSGPVEVRIESSPGYTAPGDERTLGVAIFGLGFQ
ncbi:hypothetical protein [Bryobacter aggregatus]|uniref:hypothetical protein n=1 Tax=Bryobacter aggregatus TaxID=360054 RepID=UPI0004E202A9|nr:hypothetical protein [Bryobacter aggregatus]